MALTESTSIDRLEVLEDGNVQVRTATRILRDGVKISEVYHRRVISIYESNPDLSFLDDASRAVVEAARTPERVAAAVAHLAALAAAEAPVEPVVEPDPVEEPVMDPLPIGDPPPMDE